MSYSIKLDSFEGPLDLLLHLIDKAEVDIYDIPIAEITEQYLSTIHVMHELKLDVASEFVVMAATLLAIKSKMLLPRQEQVFQPLLDIETEEADPREELVQRLLEYKRYKLIANQLREMETGRSQVFTRPPEDLTPFMREEEAPILNVSLYDMLAALEKVVQRRRNQADPLAKVSRDEVSIKDRMRQIKQWLRHDGGMVRFSQLFSASASRTEIVTTFLALLELMKAKQVMCVQTKLFADILVYQTDANGGIPDGL